MNTKFANLGKVRTALSKLFAGEQAGDAQYMIVAIGAGMQVVQGLTTDPAAVFKTIESADFQRLFLASRASSISDLYRSVMSISRLMAPVKRPDASRNGVGQGRKLTRVPSGFSAMASTPRRSSGRSATGCGSCGKESGLVTKS